MALALIALIAGCAAPSPSQPADSAWNEPVAGASAVTEWRDDGQPTAPFGPGGPIWGSPDELIRGMAQALSATGDARTTGRVVERRESGTVVGWVRIELPEPDGNLVAGDLRIEMRNDGGSWFVTTVESREYCAAALTDGACR